MKNRKLLAVMFALVLVAAIGTSATVAYAAWLGNTKSAKNTVTVGEPIKISITGDAIDGTLQPGNPDSVASSTFTIDVTDAGEKTYALKITGIKFEKEGADAWATVATIECWEYSINDGSTWIALEEGAVLAATATTSDVALKIRVSDDLPEQYAGYQLSFYVELVDVTSAL